MSYLAQSHLETDPDFQRRVRSVNVQQADVFRNDQRADIVALAAGIARDDVGLAACFIRLGAAGPGIAEKVTTEEGIDQALVTDADLLALTQANWPTVAALYFSEDGTPRDRSLT